MWRKRLKKVSVDKFACFRCGMRFRIRREVRAHPHFEIGLISDFLVEFPTTRLLKP